MGRKYSGGEIVMITVETRFNIGDAVRLKVDNTGASIGAVNIVMWDAVGIGYNIRKRDGTTYTASEKEIETAEQY
jgi:hypothetical protein